jgi:hypothetical protein
MEKHDRARSARTRIAPFLFVLLAGGVAGCGSSGSATASGVSSTSPHGGTGTSVSTSTFTLADGGVATSTITASNTVTLSATTSSSTTGSRTSSASGATTSRCGSNADCPSNLVCSAGGAQVGCGPLPSPPCSGDDECKGDGSPSERVMICTAYCQTAGGAPGSAVCVAGCQSANDCGVDEVCGSTNRCAAKTCTTGADCSASAYHVCDPTRGCVAKSCASDSDCSGGDCVNGTCGAKAGQCVGPVE